MKKQMQKYFRPIGLKAASTILVLASFFSYVAGLLRDLILSYFFGTSGMVDVYYTAFLVPDLIFNMTIAGVLGGVFIPIFRQKFLDNELEAQKLAGAFLVTSQLLILVISVLAYIFMPWITTTFFVDATLVQQTEIIYMSRIMLLSPIIFALSNSLGSILMSFKHYLSYALSPALYNVGIIAGIFLFYEQHGIYSAVYGVLIGLVLHLAIRFFDLWNLDFKFKWGFKADGLWEMYKLSIPKSLGLVFWQSSVWVYNIIGYSMVAGSIAAFNYARNVQSFAVSLFGIAVATAVFPFLVDSVKVGDKKLISDKVENAFLQILFFTIPAAFGLAVLSVQATVFLFGRGNFDEQAVILTSGILYFFAFSIPFESLIHLLSRVFYAFKNTWTPVLLNLVFLIVNVYVAFKFADNFGPKIFAISFSFGVIIQVICLLFLVRKYVQLNIKNLFMGTGKILLGSVIMMFLIVGLNQMPVLDSNIGFILKICFGVFFYFGFVKILGILKYAGIKRFL
jgi:putative peptidoglycan lipid II flippase